MNRYLVKLMFNINIDHGQHASQFDEQTRIVESFNADEAFHKARAIGKKEESIFMNQEQQQVKWQFIDVSDIYEIERIKDGEQVYSNTHEIPDHHAFINYIRQKAMVIQAKSLTFA